MKGSVCVYIWHQLSVSVQGVQGSRYQSRGLRGPGISPGGFDASTQIVLAPTGVMPVHYGGQTRGVTFAYKPF